MHATCFTDVLQFIFIFEAHRTDRGHAGSSVNWISWLSMRSSVLRFMPKLKRNLPNRRRVPETSSQRNKRKRRHGVRLFAIRSSSVWQQRRKRRKRSKSQIRFVLLSNTSLVMVRLLPMHVGGSPALCSFKHMSIC